MTIVVAGHYENEIFFITDSAITNNRSLAKVVIASLFGLPVQRLS